MGDFALTGRIYTNADGTKVVPEDSPEAAQLLGIAGDTIPEEKARALGLDKAKATEPEPKAKAR